MCSIGILGPKTFLSLAKKIDSRIILTIKILLIKYIEAPPGSLTLLSQRVPSMAKQCAHVVFHEQLITDGALPRDFGEFAALFGAQLLEMDVAVPRNMAIRVQVWKTLITRL